MSSLNTNTSEEKAHSEFGGSQAKRIKMCPGSVALSRGIERKSNDAADEGTTAHACVEFIIRNHKKLNNKTSRKEVLDHAEELFTEEMITYALDTLTWVKEQVSPNCSVYVEAKIDSSSFTTDGQGSTLDIGIANWNAKELIIADYKYGRHPVEVKKNDQLIYYALGMLIKLKAFKKIDRIRLVIIQPRAHHKNGHIREWVMSVEDAIKWGRRFKKVVKLALGKNPPLNMGEWCFFCAAKNKCPLMKNKMAVRDFD